MELKADIKSFLENATLEEIKAYRKEVIDLLRECDNQQRELKGEIFRRETAIYESKFSSLGLKTGDLVVVTYEEYFSKRVKETQPLYFEDFGRNKRHSWGVGDTPYINCHRLKKDGSPYTRYETFCCDCIVSIKKV